MDIYLETDRLVLRQFTLDDVDNLVELDSDPEVMRFLTGGKATPRATIERRIRQLMDYDRYPGYGRWAVQESASGDFVGWFELERGEDTAPGVAELGYRLRRSVWGKGYAGEGSRALIHKGFGELGMERVFALTMVVNTKSRRVMEKSGLTYVRTFHKQWDDPIEGTEHGEVEYALTRTEWLQAAESTRPAS